MFKTDVASAFNRVKLSYAAVLSQATQVDNLVLFPLVAVFGWTASPIYYSLVSEAVNWTHNGGVAGHTLDGWRRDQGKEVPSRGGLPTRPGRSCTYVDDTLGPIRPGEEETSPADADTIICRLLGKDGVASEKNEQVPCITGLGWYVDIYGRRHNAPIRQAMGALDGFTALLGTALRARQHAQWVRLDGASQRDLAFWRWLLGVGLQRPTVWSAPFWFLAGRLHDRVTHELFTDASTLIGGGYILGNRSFGQFRWEDAEKRLFASAAVGLIDINVLEFVVAVLAIITERERVLERDRGFITSG
jgi:hypothetical protein